jgi:tetratricopeptide (TPR) repeat protein
MLEQQLGNWSKARSLLERAALVQPGNAVVHQTRALLEARVHNYAAARHHFRLAVDVAPTDISFNLKKIGVSPLQLLNGLSFRWDLVCELQAWALFEASQQKVQKMRSLFKQALKVDPENMHSLQVCRFHPQFIVVSFKCRKSVGTSLYVFSTFHHSTILRQYLLGFSNQSHT